MNGKMRSSVMGLILSQFSSPLPMAQKEPVAYLYNGVRLPKLPEWDRERYPYAIMEKSPLSNDYKYFFLVVIDTPLRKNGSSYESVVSNWMRYKLDESVENWVFGSSGNSSYGPVSIPFWTNYDMYNTDDTLRLATSEPIPVYE